MAKLEFKFLANDTGLQKTITNTKKSLSGLDSSTKKMSSNMKRVLGGLGAAFAIGSVVNFTKNIINAGEAASTANARILNITEQMGLFGETSKEVADRLTAVAEATARSTGVDQNAIKLTQAKLLTFKEIALTADEVGGAFDRATQSAVDMAAAGFGTAENNAVQLGKALNDPTKGITALTKSGITFTDAEKERIKTLQESGKIGEAQNIVLQAIETQVGGTAAATANASDRMKVAFSLLQEKVGGALMPVFEKLIDLMIPLAEKITPVLVKVVERLAPVFEKLVPVILSIIEQLLPLVPVILDLVMALMPLITQLLPSIVKLFTALIPVIIPVVSVLGAVLVPIVQILSDVLQGMVKQIGAVIRSFPKIAKVFETAFKGIGDFFKSIMNGMIDGFEGFVNGFIDGINTVISGLNLIGKYGPVKFEIGQLDRMNIPRLATGGIVMPSAGGSIVNVAEAGKPEAIIPLDRLGNIGGGNHYTININKAAVTGQEIVRAIIDYEKANGRKFVL